MQKVSERCGHEPGRLLDECPAMAAPHRRRRPLQVAHSRPHRHVMRRPHAPAQLRIADPEEHAHALGRRERRINPPTRVGLDEDRNGAPVTGSSPAHTQRNASPSTAPCSPSSAAAVPIHSPRASAPPRSYSSTPHRRCRPRPRAPAPGRGRSWPGRPKACRSTTRTWSSSVEPPRPPFGQSDS